ncbi:MAG TPA: hypothetical protein VJ697_10550 [Nitrososphaeraceae archaeon]|nr:hypothetical protein [Nitrososphaeraceae archaeon]
MNILNSLTHDIQIIEIQKKYSTSGSLEEYKRTAREMEMKNALIQFVGNEEENKIKITFNSRTYEEFTQNQYIPYLDLYCNNYLYL